MGNVRPLPISRTDSAREESERRATAKGVVESFEGAHILLAVSGSANSSLLAKQLQSRYEVVTAHKGGSDVAEFDLVIIDVGNFKRWYDFISDAKAREEPTFLPVILLISRNELKNNLRAYWDIVDEFIVMPIDKVEFEERVSMLVRARHLAKTQQEQLTYLATHDRVTGLPNKQQFQQRLAELVLDASIMGRGVQVIVIQMGVDKIMNSMGHRGLDRAVAICTARLRALSEAGQYLARLATDTWGILMPMGQTQDELFEYCERLTMVSRDALDIEGEKVHIELSVGVGLYPDDANDGGRVLDCAINALGMASSGWPQFYSQSVQHEAIRFIRTEARLREALDSDQFELWYQPQISLSDHQVIGAEALIRWRMPNGLLAPPGDFLWVAESTGLITYLDRWVLRRACDDMLSWTESSLPSHRVAVNITADDLEQDDFVEFVCAELSKRGLPSSVLELELTESTLFDVSKVNLDKLNRLRDYGIDIALDDFGTGYSSLGYLHTLPINVLKIDQSFVRNILEEETDAAITKTILLLAKNFNLKTVAEGIETREQANFLSELGVDIAQGYFYGKPMREPVFRQWLSDWYSKQESDL